jgi:uncharacterized protein
MEVIMFYLVVGAVVLFILYMYIEAHRNRVIRKTIRLNKLPKVFSHYKIFFISDIHRRRVSHKLIKKAGHADIVFIGGDLAENGVHLDKVRENLNKLNLIGPVYFIWGNNDFELTTQEVKRLLEECGAKELDNACLTLSKGDSTLDFIGLNDLTCGKAKLKEAMKKSSAACRILISHNPDITKKINSTHQISLLLTGHTHGGQIRIGPIGIAKRGGWYEQDGYQLLISNGYGYTHLPLRLCAPSETHLITIV